MQYVNFINRHVIHEFIISLWPDLPHEISWKPQDFTETLNTRTKILFLFLNK